ncbi:hypothetical protein, partial [Acinetobacter baumannii]|uniref:hypothetical protein n=1 Tax=Acinetobacter baumannii TaxID=470 RepID=UPI001C085B3F
MSADAGEARLKVMIRDFDKARFEHRKQSLATADATIAARYPTGRVDCRIADTYGNILDSLGDDRRSV